MKKNFFHYNALKGKVYLSLAEDKNKISENQRMLVNPDLKYCAYPLTSLINLAILFTLILLIEFLSSLG